MGKVRYFVAAEYGSRTGRPHYHAMLYGPVQILDPELHRVHWGKGHVYVGDVTPASCAYVCKYVLKDAEGFRLMSKRPGIGCGRAVDKLGQFYRSALGSGELVRRGDVTSILRTGGKKLPIGRYLKGKVRLAAGLDSVLEPPLAQRVRRYASVVEGPESSTTRKGRADRARQRVKVRETL